MNPRFFVSSTFSLTISRPGAGAANRKKSESKPKSKKSTPITLILAFVAAVVADLIIDALFFFLEKCLQGLEWMGVTAQPREVPSNSGNHAADREEDSCPLCVLTLATTPPHSSAEPKQDVPPTQFNSAPPFPAPQASRPISRMK